MAADNSDGIDRWIIPESLVPTVLRVIHDQPAAGHPVRERTLAALRRAYFLAANALVDALHALNTY